MMKKTPSVVLRFDPANPLGPSVLLDGKEIGKDVLAIELRPGAVVLHKFVRDAAGEPQLTPEKDRVLTVPGLHGRYRIEVVGSEIAWESMGPAW